MIRIRQIKNNTRMRLRTPSIGVRRREINRTIEVQTAIIIDINIQSLEIRRRVQDANLPGLHKVIGDDNVFLVRGDLDVMGPDRRLHFVWVVEALDVVEVGDVERGDVVGCCEGEVGVFCVGCDVGAGSV